MSEDALALAAGFAPADLARWRAAATAALGLAPDEEEGLARLVRRTVDGIARGPLMTAADLPSPAPGYLGRPLAAAGGSPWDNRALVDHPDPARANAAVRAALAGGAASLELRLDPAGAEGAAVRDQEDLALVLEDAPADVFLSLDAAHGFAGTAAALLLARWTEQSVPPEARRGALNLDPLGALAVHGRAAPSLEAAVAWALRLREDAPRAAVFRADGRVVHEAGGSEAWELAFALAAGIAFLEAMAAEGLGPEEGAPRIALALAFDADVHLGIAKARAMRRLWRRAVRAAGGSEDAARARIDAFSSRRMLTALDPWTNLIRLTAAAFAAAAGGADSLTLAPFTAALGRPTPRAERLSRNISLLLSEEAGLARVGDPARGAFHHEALTDALARRAWAAFQEIAAAGGLAAFITEGRLAQVVGEARAAREAALAAGEEVVVGVTRHRAADLPQAEVEDRSPSTPLAGEPSRRPQPGASEGAPFPLLRPVRLAAPFEAQEEAGP